MTPSPLNAGALGGGLSVCLLLPKSRDVVFELPGVCVEVDGCCVALFANPPVRVEDALKNGLAKMVFGNRLYQKGCVDGDCEFGK